MSALFIFLFFVRNTQPDQTATFGTNLSGPGQAIKIPDIVLPVQPTLFILIAITVLVGGMGTDPRNAGHRLAGQHRGFLFYFVLPRLGYPG